MRSLIWKRTIASQMSNAILEKTVITISSDNTKEDFVATGEVIRFDGFLKVYMESTDDETPEEQEGLLPAMKKGDDLKLNEATATERFTYPPSRYTEASLVKKLEDDLAETRKYVFRCDLYQVIFLDQSMLHSY